MAEEEGDCRGVQRANGCQWSREGGAGALEVWVGAAGGRGRGGGRAGRAGRSAAPRRGLRRNSGERSKWPEVLSAELGSKGPPVELRQRKKPKSSENKESAKEEKISDIPIPERAPKHVLFQRFAKIFIGCLAAVTSGMMYALYLSAYHERKFWFSNRQELEREITFQGDSAIYYSYYKDMLKAPSFERGVYELTHNNKTVSLKTINAVQQMSLYPELIASILYQATGSNEIIEPVYFYIGIVFGLQGIYVTALFVTSWLMSGTWLAGMLTVAWFVINRVDTTRIEYSIPLRENWALPYFACQIAALTGYLKSNLNTYGERFCYLLMSASTYTFMMMWEYSHYLLFLQAISLFLLDTFSVEQSDKVYEVYKIYIFSLFLGYLLQFENPALLVSPLLSLVAALMLAKCLQMFVPHKENGHMLKFLEVKFGLNMTKNFTMNWLLCQESLQAPSQDFFLRLTQSSLLPFYILVLIICFLSMLQVIFRRINGKSLKETVTLEDGRIGERPEIIYHVIHTILLGSLAMVIEGLKYIWIPYVCMLAAFGVCSPELWMTLFKWLRLRTVHPILLALILSMAVPTIIGLSLWKEFFPRLMTELMELQEFYDPDTVELMTWIKRQAPVAAVFAGSPQLMGAIKLCTGWMVTSLPLYNDDDLLKRNENIYQIYSKRSAEDIYKILTSYKANYLIVEDAICNEVGPMRGCRVKDLLDIANGHMVCEEGDKLTYSKYGRFCHEVKINYSPYVNYFTRVYWNRSYFVYKINTVISFQS
ncbi:putative C-mannosyltransferase DPY19L4 isoform X2 [Homo sapiens]|uniref:putative C-mannosyltransferase DPY19L4 isoform X2 n=1 Tax=Homo sapiens TaxID=9606 RepID=UPI001FB17DBD|nr:probable C-mannosyltransferase DPY19L4 isoform X2 [Homo sapiens]XP_054216309.1 probable C-mannosyltransferase DPY19L4 isoform X2 [Homo sapiens]